MTSQLHGTDDRFVQEVDSRRRSKKVTEARIEIGNPIYTYRVVTESKSITVYVCDGLGEQYRFTYEDVSTVKSVEIFVDKDNPRHATIRIY